MFIVPIQGELDSRQENFNRITEKGEVQTLCICIVYMYMYLLLIIMLGIATLIIF